MTETIVIQKAAAIRMNKHDDIPDVTIMLCGQMPEFDSLKEAADAYDKDAEKLVDTLYRTLPGGTFDRLVAKMLLKKAGHFVIPHGDCDEN